MPSRRTPRLSGARSRGAAGPFLFTGRRPARYRRPASWLQCFVTPVQRAFAISTLVLFAAIPLAKADLYVSGFSSNGVYRFNEDTGAAIGVFIAANTGGLREPHGVMRLADGTFLVASAGTNQVLRFTGSGQYHSVFIANGLNGMPANTMDYPVDMAIGPSGDLFVGSQRNDRVLRFNAATGAFISIFINAGSVDGPSGLAWHPSNGGLYVIGRLDDTIRRFNSSGVLDANFAAPVFTQPNAQPFGVAIHPTTGVVYAVDGGNSLVRRMDPDTGAVLSNLTNNLGFAIGTRFGPGGDVFVACFGFNRIARFDGTTGAAEADLVTSTTASSVGLSGPNFFNFIPNFTAQELWRLTYFNTASNTGNAADSADPDRDAWNNALEFATGGNPNVMEPDPLQVTTTTGVLQFVYPRNINAAADGRQFIAEWSDTLQSGDWHTTQVTETVLSTNGNIQSVRAEMPAGPSGHRFVRLRVE